MSQLSALKNDLRSYLDPAKAEFLPRFFKTGTGQYAEGDKFLGVVVPNSRKVAAKYIELPLQDVLILLSSEWHEERLIALFIMVLQFKKGGPKEQERIFNAYLRNTQYINNWDLVDSSAHHIIGEHLIDKPKDILYKFANSNDLWKKRIAIIATYAFIKQKDATETFKIAEILLNDSHDLIHKAVGWMLREVGKNCGQEVEESFLQKHYKQMPRTALRYAIERMSDSKKKFYMTK